MSIFYLYIFFSEGSFRPFSCLIIEMILVFILILSLQTGLSFVFVFFWNYIIGTVITMLFLMWEFILTWLRVVIFFFVLYIPEVLIPLVSSLFLCLFFFFFFFFGLSSWLWASLRTTSQINSASCKSFSCNLLLLPCGLGVIARYRRGEPFCSLMIILDFQWVCFLGCELPCVSPLVSFLLLLSFLSSPSFCYSSPALLLLLF